MGGTIDQLIINNPWDEPTEHWRYDRESRTFSRETDRRSAGYVVATPGSKAFDDPGVFKELPEVNRIRVRVNAWREAGCPGISGTTRRLLDHWRDPELFEERRFFFCQLEAVETLIWLIEGPAGDRQGIDVRGDGGPFQRICSKMATGSGKTLVMAMVIARQILNRVANPQDGRFSKHVLVVAPGLTVRKRLAVLDPKDAENYYDRFNMVPAALRESLRQGRVLVRNWHTLNWESDQHLARKRGVDKRGAKSDLAYVREVLGDMASASNLLVINDEAHHAWRVPAGKLRGVAKAEVEEATRWIGGLDRIHRSRGILRCYDFSATPFAPSGRESTEEALFDWIVSDFSLNDAIESGLVKTPRVVIRDDGVPGAANYRSKLYHIYQWVKDDLNRKAEPHEPLPDLVTNAYYLLGKDWLETANKWSGEDGRGTPPVMITVANRTETAARVHHAFGHGKVRIDDLAKPEGMLHIDSRVLEKAEARDDAEPSDATVDDTADSDDDEQPVRRLTKQEQAEWLRLQVDTVGQIGKAGEKIQNVISVGMLTEGWDARTVTHIMGLRAFSSQLLCEQVVGRGLRRTSYEIDPATGKFPPEHVNIFGIPFTFLPHEGGDRVVPPPPPPKSRIEALPAKREFEIAWPNVIRIEHAWAPRLTLDLPAVSELVIDAAGTPMLAGLAPVVEGKPDVTRITEISLDGLGGRFQTVVFETARDVFDQMAPTWRGSREVLVAQLVSLVEAFLASDRLAIMPAVFQEDSRRRRILLTLNMNRIVRHLWGAIRDENTTALTPVFDTERPIRSTGDMLPWFTGRPWANTDHSHVNRCVFDSTWEASESFVLDHQHDVAAWAKNDHLGFEIVYVFDGAVRKYRPDFLARLRTGTMLVLEVKGQDSPQNQAKRAALDEWSRAVTEHGGFGKWTCAVSRQPGDLLDLVAAASK